MAFEQVNKTARIRQIEQLRAAFLLAPNSIVPKSYFDFNQFFGSGLRKYVRSDADGAGDGSTNNVGGATGAWTVTQANAAAITAFTWVQYTGSFTNSQIVANNANVLHDCRNVTSFTKSVAVPSTQWVATGVNGEYKTTAVFDNTKRFCTVFEDTNRMDGLNNAYSATNLQIVNPATGLLTYGADTIMVKSFAYQFNPGDIVALVTADWSPLVRNTPYYVVACTAPYVVSNVNYVDMKISSSPSLTPTITPPAWSVTQRLWSLYNSATSSRVHGVPVPGQLAPGEYAFTAWESSLTAYMKPSSGTVSNHSYTLAVTTAADAPIKLDAVNCHILGGNFWGTTSDGCTITVNANGSGIWGALIHSCNDGVIGTFTGNIKMWFNYVYDNVGHSSISVDITNAESGSHVVYNMFGDTSRRTQDWGDAQHIIASPGSVGGWWAHNVSWNCGRDPVAGNERPYGVPNNNSVIGFDSVSSTVLHDNYIELPANGCAVAMPSANPNGATPGCNNNRIVANVFDLRNATSTSKSVIIRGTAANAAPYPWGNNVFENNLCLFGDLTQQATTLPAPISLRNAQTLTTNGTIVMTMTMANNVFYGGYGTNSAYIGTQNNSTVPATVPVITAYGNIFCGNTPEGVISAGAFYYLDGVLNTTTTLANMTTYGTGPNLVKTSTEMSALYDAAGRPLSGAYGLGTQRIYGRDADGRQQTSPPTPGIYSQPVVRGIR